MRIPSWGANFLLVLSSIAVTLAGFETGLRLFLPQKLYRFPPGLFRNDPDLIFALTPGFRGALANPEYSTHVRIGAEGLRGPEVGPKRPGAIRLLGVGDSFVSAFNVEESETFLAVAGAALSRSLAGVEVEVINAGTPNFGTWHELRILRRLAPRLDPDVAVLCVYVGNDLENNLNPREATVKAGLLVETQQRPGVIPYPLRSWLQRNSMVYVFLWNGWNHLRPWFGKPETDPLRAEKDLASSDPPVHVEQGYRVSGDLLRDVRNEATGRGIPLLVVLIPTEFQVYPEQFNRLLRRGGEDPLRFDLGLPSRRWEDLARSAGLPVLDLLPIFRAHASGPYLFMSLDGHLTVEGNRLAGEAIAAALRSSLDPALTGGSM